MLQIVNKYIAKAKSVLNANQERGYTMPSHALYPHQWNWDSGFIAIGYSHYDTETAMKEIKNLFDAQWKNGMLPQIVFNREKLGGYFPEPDFWKTELSTNAPEGFLTSGITMPPIHAVTTLKIYENSGNKLKVLPFLKWLHPRLMSLHRYLYAERNYNHDGLIHIRHPWESGMDNSPSWDRVLRKIDLSAAALPRYRRKDTESGIPAKARPTNEYYDYFVYLLELFKKLKYDEKAIAAESPFLVCDPVFNSILCASNEALIKISDILHEPVKEIEQWYDLTSSSIREVMFNDGHGIFDAYDIRGKGLLELETASGFMPLFGGAASRAQSLRIYDYLNSRSFCALHQGNCFTVPSYDAQKEGFRRENYWRGPVWININWMLWHGLRRYGFNQKADSMARDILQLPIRFGFYEYFDSFDGRGYGSPNFSWTAALFIDTAYETLLKTGEKSPGKRRIFFKNRVLNKAPARAEAGYGDISQAMLNAVRALKTKYYTNQGAVDYDAIRTSKEYLQYLNIAANLRNFDPASLATEESRLAFWINLYNTIVVDGILATNIRESVKEVIGFFSGISYVIGGFSFSPDDIEHGILRANSVPPFRIFPRFGPFNRKKKFSLKKLDPRVHFALVCGSRSCAPINYYTAENIYEELEIASINFANSSEVIVIPEENRILLSSIFKWYRKDFGGIPGILGFLKKYIVDDDKKLFLERSSDAVVVDYLYYDWNLNR